MTERSLILSWAVPAWTVDVPAQPSFGIADAFWILGRDELRFQIALPGERFRCRDKPGLVFAVCEDKGDR